MSGGRAIARGAWLGCLVALAGCGLELEGTGADAGSREPDAPRPTARPDAGQTAASPEPHDASADDARRAPRDADRGAPCSFAGTFAMKLEFDVAWEGTSIGLGRAARPLIAPGSGTLVVYTTASVHEQGGALVAALKPCGTEIPDFRSGSALAPELYGLYVIESAWESAAMPTWEVTWRADCVEPGCRMHSSAFDQWIGGAPRGREVEPVDVDGDGNPGISLLTRRPGEHAPSGEPYAQPPIDITRVSRLRGPMRAHELMLAISFRAQFDGEVKSCDLIEGTGREGSVHGVAFGCTAEDSASLASCGSATVRAVDAKLPVWQVRAARYRTVRMADQRCESVRARLSGP